MDGLGMVRYRIENYATGKCEESSYNWTNLRMGKIKM